MTYTERNQLAIANKGIVWLVVRQMCAKHNLGADKADDLAQEGMLVLLSALDTFDPAKGKFSTYVFPRLRWHLNRTGGNQ